MKEYDDELIEEIKDSIDIAEFIGEYIHLTKKGKEYFGKCPFHDERTGSFTVTPHKRMYYCFGCKCGGDIITFCQEHMSMTYDMAVKYLAGLAGLSAERTQISSSVKYLKKANRKKKVEIPTQHQILNPCILDGFEKRRISKWVEEGIPQEIMERYGVRYDKRSNRIVYPVYDTNGNLINIKGRTLYDNYKDFDPPIPKYMNYYPVGDLDYLQGYNFKKEIIQQKKEIIVFEAFKSVMKADSYGQLNSVSSETSQINKYQVKILIKSHCDVVIAFDNDVSLDAILAKEEIQMLKKFTNVFAIIDTEKLLGDISDKNSPADKGKEIWEILYKTKIKI